jgi:low temperature requirement protein LtrA
MVEKNDSITLAEYQDAYRTMQSHEARKGFKIHLAAYIAVNSFLATANLLFVPETIFFVFPLVGWGIGLTVHYTIAVRLLDRLLRAEEGKAEHLAKARSIGTPRKA